MLALTLFSFLLAAAPIHGAAVSDIQKRTALTDCLTAANVPQNLPGSAAFTQAIKPFNLRIPFTPIAVAAPTTVDQVVAAVTCGNRNNATISAKSGGHSYASHGLGGENGHFMIDIKGFSSVSVDSSGIASVGPGGRLGNIASSLYSQGQRAFSHGTCPGVGVGGHVVGGGYGYSSHTKGLASDNLVEATVVLANATVVTASTKENPDLFWAIRGAGGGGFGVITNYKFQTFAAPGSNTVFSYTISNWNAAKGAQVHKALQDYASSTSMPAEMNLRLFVTSASLQLEGYYYGSPSQFNSAIAPFSSAIGGASWSTQTMGWLDALHNYAYMSLSQSTTNYDIHETFFSKSLMTVQLTQSAFDTFWQYGANTAKGVSRDWYLIVDAHGGPTSAISKVGADDTSYAHRNAILKYEFYDRVDSGSYPSDGQSFLNGWVSSAVNAMSGTTLGMYINYADTSLTADYAHTHYWLDHYPRLQQIKKAYDPAQRFSNPQAVVPA